MQGKVEICGVNTARLKVLTQKEMDRLLLQAKDGDDNAHRNGLQEPRDAPVSGFYVQLWVNPLPSGCKPTTRSTTPHSRK